MPRHRLAPWLLPCIGLIGIALGALGSAWFAPEPLAASANNDGRDLSPPELPRGAEVGVAETAEAAVTRESLAEEEAQGSFGSAANGALTTFGSRSIVEGVVRRLDGGALAGVTIRATPWIHDEWSFLGAQGESSVSGGAPPPSRTDVSVYARYEARLRAGMRETTTDAAGRYRLELDPAAPSHIEAWHEGFELRPLGRDYVAEHEGEVTLEFLAHPLFALEVDVRLPDGSHPRRAILEVRGSESHREIPWTPRRTRVSLAEGSWRLAARVERSGMRWNEGPTWVEVEVVAGVAQREPIRFVIEEPARLEGRLTWPQAELLGTDALHVCRESESESESYVFHEDGFTFGERTIHGPPGNMRYRLQGLERGSQKICVRLGARVLLERTVDVQSTVTLCDLEVPPLERLRAISVLALDPEGRPVLDARIWINTAERTQSDVFAMLRRRGANRWILASAIAPELSPEKRELEIQASCERFGTTSMRCDPTTLETLEIRFVAPGKLEVDLRSKEPTRVAATLRRHQPRSRESDWSGFGDDVRELSAPTVTAWSKLQPGTYVLEIFRVNSERRSHQTAPLHKREIEIHSGSNTVSVDL
ncbi:MAG: hypothetical protein JNM84_25010 [Planctomycetes bacterium]|nr:hypothetical protein [Planctomycetota bacterium]